MYKTLPWYSDAAPDFSVLRNVLLRQGERPYIPLYELFVNPGVIHTFLDSEDTGVSDWRFYLYAGYDYVPVWPQFNMPLGDFTDTSKPYPVKSWADLKEYPWPAMISYEQFYKTHREIPNGMRIIGQMGGP